jgi:soluble lytic murein transglycosylase-like protein
MPAAAGSRNGWRSTVMRSTVSERIPFAETRNYVQHVMKNLQVYRARFSASTRSA